MANAILAEPAFAADRVAPIEDTAELQCAAQDKIEILTKRTEPQVTMGLGDRRQNKIANRKDYRGEDHLERPAVHGGRPI